MLSITTSSPIALHNLDIISNGYVSNYRILNDGILTYLNSFHEQRIHQISTFSIRHPESIEEFLMFPSTLAFGCTSIHWLSHPLAEKVKNPFCLSRLIEHPIIGLDSHQTRSHRFAWRHWPPHFRARNNCLLKSYFPPRYKCQYFRLDYIQTSIYDIRLLLSLVFLKSYYISFR